MRRWLNSVLVYRDPKVLVTLFLGFSSGLPFLLTLATLHVWLKEAGINKTTIGFFVLVTIPYSLKFIWAPLIDHFQVPFLCTVLGKRRGWMLTSQILLAFSLLALGTTHPHDQIVLTAVAAFFVALFSATQDIIIEAFRVESLEPSLRGPGASASSLGYRLGMWVSGAGALYLASRFSWFNVYGLMACCVGVGMIATLLSKEPTIQGQPQCQEKSKRILYPYHHLGTISEENYPDLADSRPNKPFWAEFYQKLQASLKGMLHRSDLRTILCFIFFYKIGDTVLNTMTMPFLLEMGFSKLEIAHVAKSFGIGAMIFGGFIGGAYMVHGSLAWTLVITAVLQMVASLMFWMQAFVGHHIGMLFVTIGIENFAVGLGNAAFIVYLSSRCRMPHTATHFALLTSFGSFCRVMLSSIAGWTSDHLTWPDFYSLTAVLCAPALLLTIFKTSCFEYEEKITDPLSADKPLKITP